MSSLYIIGNGFDSAHGLKTSYWHFREYLSKYAGDFLISLERLYGFEPVDYDHLRDGSNIKHIRKHHNDDLYTYLWQSFEYALGYANEGEMLDYSSSIVNSLGLESGPIGIEDTMNQYWEERYQFIVELQDYLSKWVRQIRLFKANVMNSHLYRNSTDFFLTFNYTNTLERIYQIPSSRILHIHGGIPPYCEQSPVIGHGNRAVIEEYRERAYQADENCDEGEKSISNAIATFYARSFKDTNSFQFLHCDFFNSLNDNIDCVEIIGHSLGDVDLPYFRTIKRNISDDAEWNVYYHEPNDKEKFETILASLEIPPEHIHALPASDFWN